MLHISYPQKFTFGKGRKSKASIHCAYKKKKKKVASQTLCRENLLAEIPRDFLEKGFAEETEVTG